MVMYDTIIVGAGVTGYATAMYAGRLGMKTLVIGAEPGGTITKTNMVENYPGFIKLTGQELADNLKNHALDYKEFVEFKDAFVTKIERSSIDKPFVVHMDQEKVLGKTIIYATGSKWRELKVPGHDEYKNLGVHYCALCDAFFYRGKTVAVVGGSDSAVKDALVLAEHAKKVFIIYRKETPRAEPPNMKRFYNSGIELINNANVTEIKGEPVKGVTSIILDREYNGSNELPLDGLFIAIGHIPLSEIAENAGVELNEKKEIKINRLSETNVPGFFAAGDVVDSHFKQAITGVGEGVVAAHNAYEYIGNNEIKE